MNRLALNERELRIVQYLTNHPLSTIREIADNYTPKRANYDVVKETVQQLSEENKVELLDDNIPFYFVKPSLDNFLDILTKIMSSKKIKIRPLSSLQYENRNDNLTFPLIIKNLIALYHLQLKIMLLERWRNTKPTSKARLTKQNDIEKFHKLFLQNWKQSIINFETDSAEELLDILNIAIGEDCLMNVIYHNKLKTAKEPLVKKLDVMNDVLNHSDRIAGDKFKPKKYDFKTEDKKAGRVRISRSKASPRYIRQKLRTITDEKGRFDWERIYTIQELQEGFMGFTKVFDDGEYNQEEIEKDGYMGNRVNPLIYKLAIKQARKELSKLSSRQRKLRKKILDEKIKIKVPRIFDLREISKFL